MSLEFLEKKKKAIDDVLGAYRAFQAALRELPPEWAKEILEDIGELRASPPNAVPPQEKAIGLLKPTKAIYALLAKHPSGMRAGEITDVLVGHLITSSANQYKLVYSTLAVLKRTGKINQDSYGRYHLPIKSSP